MRGGGSITKSIRILCSLGMLVYSEEACTHATYKCSDACAEQCN